MLPSNSQLALDPRLRVGNLKIEKCKVMNSKKKPLWLAFDNVDPMGEKIMVMFKSGDDLRQDQMTLQLIRFVDKLWIAEGKCVLIVNCIYFIYCLVSFLCFFFSQQIIVTVTFQKKKVLSMFLSGIANELL
tara:strand:- start:1001 stop:1393 length:393 start_codon:yes stop_codon:yes gene_type:complete